MLADLTGYIAGGPTPFSVVDGAVGPVIDTRGATAMLIHWNNPGGAGTLFSVFGNGGTGTANTFIQRQPQALYPAGAPMLIDCTGKKQVQIDCSVATSATGTCQGIYTFIYSPLDCAMTGWTLIPKRTPNVFRFAQAAVAGNTAVWTPNANRRFMLLGYRISISGLATLGAAGDFLATLQDGVNPLPFGLLASIPVAAGALPNLGDTGWMNLGHLGYPSPTIGNVLNVNLPVALATGTVNVWTAGVEY